MTEHFTLDSNILVEAHDLSNPEQQRLAETLIRSAASANCTLTLQAVGEFYHVITRKLHTKPRVAATFARNFAATFPLAAPTTSCLDRALEASEKGRLAFWDAYLLAAAGDAGCTLCFSLDMHDGATLGGMTVRRPFDGSGLSKSALSAIAP